MKAKGKIVVGVGGHIGHGKDEVGKFLVEQAGFFKVNFADSLKEEVLARLRLTLKEVVISQVRHDDYARIDPGLRWTRERGGDEAWWDRRLRWELWQYKRPVVRRLLQEYGTEVRRADDFDYWVKAWYSKVLSVPDDVVVTDMRFLNEFEYVKMFGRGYAVKVERPGSPVDLSHESERFAAEFDGWDAVIVNDGSLEDLAAKVRRTLDFLLG